MRPHRSIGIRGLIAGLLRCWLRRPRWRRMPAMPSQFIEPPILAEQVAKRRAAAGGRAAADGAGRRDDGMAWPDPGPAWRRDAHADGVDQGYAHHGRLWLCAAGRTTTRDYKLVPDILQAFEVEEGRIFTFHLRPGHKWSDGKPFTTRGFPLLLGRRGEQPGSVARRPAGGAAGRRRSAEGRDPGRDHHPLQLVEAELRSSCRRWPGRARSTSTGRATI